MINILDTPTVIMVIGLFWLIYINFHDKNRYFEGFLYMITSACLWFFDPTTPWAWIGLLMAFFRIFK